MFSYQLPRYVVKPGDDVALDSVRAARRGSRARVRLTRRHRQCPMLPNALPGCVQRSAASGVAAAASLRAQRVVRVAAKRHCERGLSVHTPPASPRQAGESSPRLWRHTYPYTICLIPTGRLYGFVRHGVKHTEEEGRGISVKVSEEGGVAPPQCPRTNASARARAHAACLMLTPSIPSRYPMSPPVFHAHLPVAFIREAPAL